VTIDHERLDAVAPPAQRNLVDVPVGQQGGKPSRVIVDNYLQGGLPSVELE
jgi:hypothetical protein